MSENDLKRAAAKGETSYEGNLPVRQRIARCLWFDQSFEPMPKRTDDGQKLVIFSPGWWNLNAGPDFRNAAVKIGKAPLVKGDVEVHLLASDWEKAVHDKDPAYAGVVLVVCVWNDTGRTAVKNSFGAVVPQLSLEPYLKDGAATFNQE